MLKDSVQNLLLYKPKEKTPNLHLAMKVWTSPVNFYTYTPRPVLCFDHPSIKTLPFRSDRFFRRRLQRRRAMLAGVPGVPMLRVAAGTDAMSPPTLRRPRWPAPPKEAGVSCQKEGYPAPPGAVSNQPRAVPGAAGCADAQSDEQRCGSAGLIPTRRERHVWQLTLREAKEARKDSFLKRTISKTSLLLGVERQIYFYVVIKKGGNALLWLQAYTYLRNKEWHKQGNVYTS